MNAAMRPTEGPSCVSRSWSLLGGPSGSVGGPSGSVGRPPEMLPTLLTVSLVG